MATDTGTNAAQTLDCKGLLCPMPIIKLAKAIKTVQVGESIEMLATDPGSVPDMAAFEKQTGNKILKSEQQGEVYRFLVQRAK
jgi:tRNA 2-thiouridine synthesizing protein A